MKIAKENLKNYVGKKIKIEDWVDEAYFILKFIGEHFLFGVDSCGNEDTYKKSCGWETYEEPKQQVKMWQALVKYEGKYSLSEYFYKDAKDAQGKFNDHFIKLLPHTEIEVEV